MTDVGNVAMQVDLSNIPSAALSAVGLAQGLRRAVSADNVNPLAVVQVQAIGTCFQSNGPWAARAPDLLSRTSSARLERLSAWIGWAKGDTPSFMAQTAGGRTASLLCLALGSLYPQERCGLILLDISRDFLPSEKQTSGISQLGEVCVCLENKLGCLGFGNHLALQATRLRQCFFAAGAEIPRDLVDTPTEEIMHAFLVGVRDALRDESLVLYYTGTKCAGTLLALVLAMCPEDVRADVNGETIARGRRDSIVFSVAGGGQPTSEFYVESKLISHTNDFSRTHVQVQARHEHNPQLSFSWDGMLSSQLDIALANVGAGPCERLKLAMANLIASTAISFKGRDWFSSHYESYRPRELSFLPAQGMKILLGPAYRQVIQERLGRVLCPPSDTLQDPASEYRTVHDVAIAALPLSQCTCNACKTGAPWIDLLSPRWEKYGGENWRSCRVAQLWLVMGQVADAAQLSLLVQAAPSCSLRPEAWETSEPHIGSIFWKVLEPCPGEPFRRGAEVIHNRILDLVGQWTMGYFLKVDEEHPPRICSSANGSTVYPVTLQFPAITNPWVVQYNLEDGRLHCDSDCYDTIISTSLKKGAAEDMVRKESVAEPASARQPIVPSRSGEHSALTMTLRPAFVQGRRVLILRCLVGQRTRNIEANFTEIHQGMMRLTPADRCEHDLGRPFAPTDGDSLPLVRPTSVITPTASGTGSIGITLTQANGESQFLCCISHVKQLYQGDCCMPCALAQARKEGYEVVIGGSPSRWIAAAQDNLQSGHQEGTHEGNHGGGHGVAE